MILLELPLGQWQSLGIFCNRSEGIWGHGCNIIRVLRDLQGTKDPQRPTEPLVTHKGPQRPTGAHRTLRDPQGPTGPSGVHKGPQDPQGPTMALRDLQGPTEPSGVQKGPQEPQGPTRALKEAMISVSLALSQTPAYPARPWIRMRAVSVTPKLLLVLIAPTHEGMARLSWLGRLVTYPSLLTRPQTQYTWPWHHPSSNRSRHVCMHLCFVLCATFWW